MAIIKCKMCGGDISLNEEKTFGTCEYCGSTMTFPKVSDEQRAARFNRGNHFRRQGEFDKALSVYEAIVQEDDTDAEAHWCCALCRFGIEYVEDPATYEYIPTCHRASFDSFLEDVDYLAAVEHSDGITRRQYQKDAVKIAEVQKGILATSQNEEPFDVFICYKETDDATNKRTRDSIDAQEIYYQLTNEGYRVFFSRITLEDKVGAEYEPYIFAALNSAKVMVAIGSKPEYFNAVWVKNEWSRFLAMMRKDRSKLLLPCYKSMDPYDLPEQLGVLQSYDMAKIGFMQDLIRGIEKVLAKHEPKQNVSETVVINSGAANVEPLLKRAFMFLEDGEWGSADEYCEKVLDQDPENAQAYLGKLMAELHVSKQDDLQNCKEPFDENNNFKKAVRFGDEQLSAALNGYITQINERKEIERCTPLYNKALASMDKATGEAAYKLTAAKFKEISGFRNADALAEECLEKAEEARVQNAYMDALKSMNANNETAFRRAAELFKTIPGYKDADTRVEQCLELAETARKNTLYNQACAWMKSERIEDLKTAENALFEIPGWKDADEKLEVCQKKIEELEAKEEAERQEQIRKAEEAKKKAADIVAVFKADSISKEEAALKEELAASKNKIDFYTKVQAQCEETEVQIVRLREELKAIETQETDLQAQRSNLGLFAGKEKRKLDETLAVLATKKRQIQQDIKEKIDLSKKQDAEKEEVEHNLAEAKANVVSLETKLTQIEKDRTKATDEDLAYSYEDAVKEYLSNPAVTHAVNTMYYSVSSDRIVFGRYGQKKDGIAEPIEWQVVTREKDRVFVISKKALDCRPYNTDQNDVTWETCDLRKWLNSIFLNAAFSAAEQTMILSVNIGAHKNPQYSAINQGDNTTDKIFLPSITEINRHFSSNEARKCDSTEYAVAKGASSRIINKTGDISNGCNWWLRTIGKSPYRATCVDIEGNILYGGGGINAKGIAVRPAMWIFFKS